MTETETIPAMMKAVEIRDKKLVLTERPVPVPERGEVLIRVQAAGINRPDLMQRKGLYPPPPGVTDIPGLEIAGEIVSVGKGVISLRAGQEVCALVAGGGYAEYCVAPALQTLVIPKNIGVIAAAGIPETFFTVWSNLVMRGNIKKNDRVLIHGGASGIGTAAIQVARARGATVYTTAGTDEKCRAAEKLGAARAVNYRTEDFQTIIMKETKDRGVDLILDMIGGDYVPKHLDLLAPDGCHVSIAIQGGRKTEIDLFKIMSKRLTLTGSTLRPQTPAAKALIAKAIKKTLWPMIRRQRIMPVIDRVFPLAEAQQAHDYLEAGSHFGKIILRI